MENTSPSTKQPHQGIPASGPDNNFSQELSRGVPLGSFGGLRMPQPTLLNTGPLNPAPIVPTKNPLAAQASVKPTNQQQPAPQSLQVNSTQEFYPATTVPPEFLQQLVVQKAISSSEQTPEAYPTTTAPGGWTQPQAAPQQIHTTPAQAAYPQTAVPESVTQQYPASQTIQTAPVQTASEGWTQQQAAPQQIPTTPAQAPNPTIASSEAPIQQTVAPLHIPATPDQTVDPVIPTTEAEAISTDRPESQAIAAPLVKDATVPQSAKPEKPVAEAKHTTENTVPFTKATIPKPQPKRIGDILIDEGYITDQQLAQALQEGKATNSPLGAVLIRMGYIDEVNLGKALAKLHGLQYIDTSNLEIDPEVMKLVPSDFIRRHMVVPYRMDHAHKRIEVIMARPDNLHILDEVALLTGYRPIPRVSTHNELVSLLDKYYRSRSSTDDAMARIEEDFSKQDNQYDQGGITKELEAEMDADDAPVVQLVNSILIEALDSNASDIHIEPQKERLLIRFRIDGILREMHSIPKKMGAAFVSRVKVASGMDIAERRRPQDGRMRLKEGSQEVDMRVNTLATQFGEKIVIRLLRPNATTGGIEKLGLRSDEAKRIAKMVHAPHGIILVTGPTGSGKTTTLYSCLREINSPERNITTIEDPVEYPLSGVNQTQVSHKAGLTFSLCLRAILRQDPDVVMVGEIRDHETLEAAIHASLTGHLVFSTLHTNSASKTITRLLEMGAPNYLVSTAVIGILAQRLVRKVCNGCRTSYTSTEEEMAILNITEPVTLHKGEGCDKCSKSGYSGRVGLYEIMTMNREVQELVTAGASTFQIQDAAVKNGMLTLGMDGKRKIYEGLTTVAEVTRVLGLDLDEA